MTSRDGHSWTPKYGLKSGVPSLSVISPSSNIGNTEVLYDVIVIGAGYCGLTAARNMAAEGLKVLLLEGRDRIGGRSWSSNIGGYPFEMGGTWVHWGQANTWREVLRYQMEKDVEKSLDFSNGVKHFELNSLQGTVKMSHEDEVSRHRISWHLIVNAESQDELIESGLKKFTNIDGVYGRKTIPLPHTTFHNPESIALDFKSAQDRINEIAPTLSPQERTVLEASILLASGATLEATSFHELMHWWAMCGYTYQGWMDLLITWKFRDGQSTFARKFFEEALSTKRLYYLFNTPVQHIYDTGSTIKIHNSKPSNFRCCSRHLYHPIKRLG